ncbi:MAG: hypothetical protein QOH33_2234, partial [Paraburkholderia sp.]|nr:hypothetical protein [Paraburkholderia sp.]
MSFGIALGVVVRKKLKCVVRFCRERYAGGLTFGALLFGLGATLIVYFLLAALVEREARLRFENDSSSVEQQIAVRVRLYSDVLVTMRALMSADDEVTSSEFRDFVTGLDLPGRYPGFQTLNCAFYVHDSDLALFAARQRANPMLQREGVAFSVHPRAARPVHEILTYVEPLESNLASVGIDLYAMPDRENVLKTLRDSGEAVSSGRRIFAERGAQFVGLAMRLPVYRRGMPAATTEERRRAYVGSVGAGIRINGMMAALVSPATLHVMRYRIYDGGSVNGQEIAPSPATLLYDSVAGVSGEPSSASSGTLSGGVAHGLAGALVRNGAFATAARASADEFLKRRTTQVFAGRRWLVVFSANPRVLTGSQGYLPNMAVFSGCIISLLLAGLTYALSSARSRALKVADEMTAGLRESEMARAEAQRIAHLGDWRIDLHNGTAHLSNEMARLIGRRSSVAALGTLARAIEPADRHMLLRQLQQTCVTREPFELECRYRSTRGRRGWLRVIGRACGAAGSAALRGTALEITKQKSIDRARELEHFFTLQLATATNESDVFEHLVALLTKGMDWDAGAFWPAATGRHEVLRAVYSTSVVALESLLRARAPEVPINEVPPAPHWSIGRAASSRLAEGGIVTTLSFPLCSGSDVLGVAEFYSRERRHAEPQVLAMAGSIASQMSHFLQRRRAENNLHFLANHDVLTGLPNRLMFKEHLEDSLSRANA